MSPINRVLFVARCNEMILTDAGPNRIYNYEKPHTQNGLLEGGGSNQHTKRGTKPPTILTLDLMLSNLLLLTDEHYSQIMIVLCFTALIIDKADNVNQTNLAAIIGTNQNFDYGKLGVNIKQCYWNKYYLPTYLHITLQTSASNLCLSH